MSSSVKWVAVQMIRGDTCEALRTGPGVCLENDEWLGWRKQAEGSMAQGRENQPTLGQENCSEKVGQSQDVISQAGRGEGSPGSGHC